MRDIVLWSLMSVMGSVENRKGSCELFGYDFMLSHDPNGGLPKVWLIEVNSSPAMDYSTPVTTPLVKKVMEDTAKVMVDYKEDPNADTGEWELLSHPYEKQYVGRPIAGLGKLVVQGTKIEKPKRSKRKKSKEKNKEKATKLKEEAEKQEEPEEEDLEEEDLEDVEKEDEEDEKDEEDEGQEGDGEEDDNGDDAVEEDDEVS